MPVTADPVGRPVAEVDTPALLIDLAALERNLDRMAALGRRTGKGIRPHAKTHKSREIARMQLARGAIGITCAKLGEAEVLAEAGIAPLLVSTEITGGLKVARLIALARRTKTLTVVDDVEGALAISSAAVNAGLRVGVLVDVNVGQGRSGVAPEGAADLAARVAELPGLRFLGLQAYEGHLQHVYDAADRLRGWREAIARLASARAAIEGRGLTVEIASTAGTGTSDFAAGHPAVTDVQPGSYVFMDCDYGRVETLPYESALTVLTSVVSRQRPDAVLVDAGWKAVTVEAGMPIVKGHPELVYATMGDEHGALRGETRPGLGERVELVPSHCDTTVNLYDRYHVIRDGMVEAIWPIDARGRTQ